MGRDLRDLYRSNRTCCLVIPLFHNGIYTILVIQLSLASFGMTMSFVGPAIATLAVPEELVMLLRALYCILVLIHMISIVLVFRNRTRLFGILKNAAASFIALLFLTSFTAIVVTGSQHTQATKNCIKLFHIEVNLQTDVGDTPAESAKPDPVGFADTVCDAFGWVQFSVMILLWVMLSGVQVYFYFKEKVYFQLKDEDAKEDAKNAELAKHGYKGNGKEKKRTSKSV